MMRCRIEILPRAWEDLKAIEDYYAVQFSEETAVKVAGWLLSAINRLSDHPDMGSETPDEWLNDFGYRLIVKGKHAVLHRQMGDIVFVYHIANTEREYAKLFY